MQLFFVANFVSTPIDIYGIRYDLQLSDSPRKMFAIAPRQGVLDFFGLFGVGPGGIPANIVPDAGSTLGLLLYGIAALAIYFGCRRAFSC